MRTVSAPRRFRCRAPYGLVFANILLEPLTQLATPIARLVAPNGHVVLSGLLTAQAGAALASYRARGLVLVRRIRLEGWATLVLSRPRSSAAGDIVQANARNRSFLPCGCSIAGACTAAQ